MSANMKPAREVPVGWIFLHPDTGLPLRVVEPRNLHAGQGVRLMVDNNAVFAVDDESGLYAIHPDNHVEVPYNVPLALKPDDQGSYVVLLSFMQDTGDDLPVMRENLKRGNITADPEQDFEQAAMQQLACELHWACEKGMSGFFQCHRVITGHGWDKAKMGWGTHGIEGTGPDDDEPTPKKT